MNTFLSSPSVDKRRSFCVWTSVRNADVRRTVQLTAAVFSLLWEKKKCPPRNTYTSLFSDTLHTHPWDTRATCPAHTLGPPLRVWHTSLILWMSARRKTLACRTLHPHQSLSCKPSCSHASTSLIAWLEHYWFVFILLRRDLPPRHPSTGLQLLARERSGWGADVLHLPRGLGRAGWEEEDGGVHCLRHL